MSDKIIAYTDGGYEVKDTECLHCKKFFDCKGKPKSNVSCVSYEERKRNRKDG